MTRPLRSPPYRAKQGHLCYYRPVRQRTRIGTQPLAGSARLGRSLAPPTGGRVGVRLPTFRAEAADQAHVAFMPDTVWPRSGHPPDSSRAAGVRPGFDATYLVTTRQRRPLQRGTAHRLPGPHLTHHVRLFHLAHHDGLQPTQQVAVCSLPPQGGSEGPTFISCTAPLPRALLHRAPFHVRGTPPTGDRDLAGQGGLGTRLSRRQIRAATGDDPVVCGQPKITQWPQATA